MTACLLILMACDKNQENSYQYWENLADKKLVITELYTEFNNYQENTSRNNTNDWTHIEYFNDFCKIKYIPIPKILITQNNEFNVKKDLYNYLIYKKANIEERNCIRT